MLLRLLLPTLLLLTVTALPAQAFFEYQYTTDRSEYLRQACRLTGGELALVVSRNIDATDAVKALVYLLDEAGNPTGDAVLIPGIRTRARAVAADRTGGFWVLAMEEKQNSRDQWSLFHYDRNGDLLDAFARGGGDEEYQMWDISVLDDGSVVVAGSATTLPLPVVVRVSATGELLFSRQFNFPGSGGEGVVDAVVATDGGILVAGSSGDQRNDEDVNFISLLTESGEIEWVQTIRPDDGRRLNSLSSSLQVGPDSTIYWATGVEVTPTGPDDFTELRPVFIQLTPNGVPIEAAEIDLPSRSLRERDVLLTGDGRLLLPVANTELNNLLAAELLEFDPRTRRAAAYAPPGSGIVDLLNVVERPGGAGYFLFGSAIECGNFALSAFCLATDTALGLGPDGCPATRRTVTTTPLGLVTSPVGEVVDYPMPPAVPARPERLPYERLDVTCNPGRERTPDVLLSSCRTDQLTVPLLQRPLADPLPVLLTELTIRLTDPTDRGTLLFEPVPADVTVVASPAGSLSVVANAPLTSERLASLLQTVRYRAPDRRGLLTPHPYTLLLGALCQSPTVVDGLLLVTSVDEEVSVSTVDTSLCRNGQLLLPGSATGRWSTGLSGPSLTVMDTGTYVQVTLAGCRRDTLRYRVTDREAVPLLEETYGVAVCVGDSSLFVPRREADVALTWLDGAPAGDRFLGVPGSYQLLRDDGCSTAVTTVEVTNYSCCAVYLPNAFSPNGDGINDRFRPFPATARCDRATDYELAVYDRWGGEVFRGSGTAGWDGMLRDERPADSGAYVYVFRYFDGLQVQESSGSLILLR